MSIASILFKDLVDRPIPESIAGEIQMTGVQVVSESLVDNWLNGPSASSVGVYTSKSLFKEHLPYSLEDDATVVVLHNHFIREVRRHLSGVTTDSRFSPEEQLVYDNYILELNGGIYDTSIQAVLDAVDFWLVEEVQEHTHRSVDRTYSATHPWMKVQTN